MPSLRASRISVHVRCVLLVALAVLLPASASAQVSGTVRDAATLQPIDGAIVTLQGTSTRAVTNAAGTFSLPGVSGSNLVIVAANKGYYHGPSVVTTPASGLVYDLVAVPVMNNPAYNWVPNTNCNFCHTDQFTQYTGTAMDDTGDNAWVYDLYNGTGTAGGLGGFVYTRDSVHAATFPEAECASCHQPQHWIKTPFSALEPIGALTADGQAGVSCEICHKVADVNENQLNATGFHAGAVTVTRPDAPGGVTQQVMYGPLGDVDYIITDAMNPSYQPGIETTTCAVCHQYNSDPDQDQDFDEPGSISGQSTYSEWLASPYGADPNAPEYQTCADCHMPAASNDGCVVLPVTREPGQIRSHDIQGTTPAFLENAVTMTVAPSVVGTELQVQVNINNDQTGHAVPGGISLRNMVLLVEATRVSDSLVLNHTGTQTVHALGGVGSPAMGYYSGLPGKLFAKVLEASGTAPVLFTEATGVQFDTRILPLATDTTDYTFDIPAGTDDIEIRARLIYRRAFRSVIDSKGWTTTGNGDPLADIQAPHYGHLMEEVVQVIGTDNDNCADAFPLTEGTFAFDTTGATTDGPDEPTACDFFSYTNVGNDIWYLYTPSCTGDATISLCASGYDTKIAIYAGVTCPTVASAIACNDDACNTQSEVTFSVVQGGDYLVRIGGYNAATGAGNMVVSCAPSGGGGGPANDACAAATVIGIGQVTGTLVDATNDGTASCANSAANEDVWYRIDVPCTGTLLVDTCGSNASSGIDTGLALFGSCGGAEIACNDDWVGSACAAGTSSLDSALSLAVNNGDTIYVRVTKYGGTALAGFVLNVDVVCDCQAVVGLTCQSSGSDVLLGWTNGEAYDTINVYRDAVLVATIGGGLIGYTDAGVSSGSYTYTVEGVCAGGGVADGTDCSLTHVAGPTFRRTDCNADGGRNLADAVLLLNVLFPLAPPGPTLDCADACDCNDDGSLAIADAVCILVSLFGTPPYVPPAPLTFCGEDPTSDVLDCSAFSACP